MIFHIRDEGQPIRWGFNFYPWKSAQFGFLFSGFGFIWWRRFNKRIKRFYISVEAY